MNQNTTECNNSWCCFSTKNGVN